MTELAPSDGQTHGKKRGFRINRVRNSEVQLYLMLAAHHRANRTARISGVPGRRACRDGRQQRARSAAVASGGALPRRVPVAGACAPPPCALNSCCSRAREAPPAGQRPGCWKWYSPATVEESRLRLPAVPTGRSFPAHCSPVFPER